MTEQWKPVAGWEGFYEISNEGRVKSVARVISLANRWGGMNERRLPAKIMAQTEFAGRCWQVTLKEGGRRATEYIRRLVCAAFCGKPEEGQTQVAHWDGNGFNNHANNLRWASPLENAEDAVRLGRTNKGEKHPLSILTFEVVKSLRELNDNKMDAEIASKIGASESAVMQARLGHSWKWVEND